MGMIPACVNSRRRKSMCVINIEHLRTQVYIRICVFKQDCDRGKCACPFLSDCLCECAFFSRVSN